ncbi:hypothetical protein BG618_03980 [Pseudonocardia autotrophica]|nr:hypothetical protein BG618_03980 [Pseudonocardia autotrophica]
MALRPVRLHQALSRTVHTITLPDPDGPAVWAVETRTTEDHRARLYRDGQRTSTAEMPATFTVPEGGSRSTPGCTASPGSISSPPTDGNADWPRPRGPWSTGAQP